MTQSVSNLQDRLLVLMPSRKDAERTVALFSKSPVACVICNDLVSLCREIEIGAGAALLTEDEIIKDKSECLASTIKLQPSWSYFPLIVLTHDSEQRRQAILNPALNVTLVERPVRIRTLVSVVEATLRARKHQYEIQNILSDLANQTEALRKSEERFRALVSQATAGIAQIDATGRFLFANDKFCEILGYGNGELVEFRIEDVTVADDFLQNAARFESLLHGGQDFGAEMRFRRKDGTEAWISSSIAAVRDRRGEFQSAVLVALDITERQRAKEALARAMSQLEQTNQNLERMVTERTSKLRDTIGELEAFSYSISHDMRSPLRAMQGFSKALLEDYSDKIDSDGKDLLQRIEKGARRLDLLTRDVLAYSKVAKGDFELHPIALDSFIPEIIQSFEFEKVNIHIAHPLPVVLGHEPLISQIISNLVGNAIKFTAPGTKPEIRIYADVLGDQVRISVQDNGIGIHPSHFQRIFEIFGRVYSDKDYEGTGIGLAVVKKAAERLGGQIGVESDLGKGSRFWFTLKLKD